MADDELLNGKLHAQLRLHEGVEKKVYLDTEGIETIGVGRNLKERGLSEEEIDYLLNSDIRICIKELRENFNWFKDLDIIRQRVLIDMMFNLGMPRLKGFVNMLSALEKGNWLDATDEMLNSKWAKQVGSRSSRLAEMMETGEDYIG